MECPQTIPLLKRLYHLPALPLRGRQALHHLADLSDSSGSDSSRGAPDQAVRSVGCSARASGGVALSVDSALRSRDASARVLSPHSSVTKQEKVLVYLLVYQVS